jgi:flagellar basal body-associated protein FliL
MDKKEKLLVALLIVAIVFSVVSLTFAFSMGFSPAKFHFVKEKGEAPVANVFIFIESPQGVENGVQ